MTAEVAILNKSAVALAADSAVTIGQPPNTKIYNTVNKIFELSGSHPVGIMIYGRLDFMGLPLETIIKEYRRDLGKTYFSKISDYRDDFSKYLLNKVPRSADDEVSNLVVVLSDTFFRANKDIDNLVMQDIIRSNKFKKSKVNTFIQRYFTEKTDAIKSLNFADGFSKKVSLKAYDQIVDGLIDHCFRSNFPTATTKRKIKEYAAWYLAKADLSSYRTGVVITGFGNDEMCPSLDQFEMDGVIDGRLKSVRKPYLDVGRNSVEAEILGFAQDDMVKSFINGIDPQIQDYLREISVDAIREAISLTVSAILKDKGQEKQFLAALKPQVEKFSADLTTKSEDYIKKVAREPIRDMIRSMPKQELATLASSLIEITSLKRKVTRVQETVGGEVDVAIISKSEGFVWTKRKHYFPRELNGRFFARHYNGI